MTKEVKIRPRNNKYILKRLGQYLYKFKWLMFLALLLTLIANIFELLGPKLSGMAIDSLSSNEGKVDFEQVFYYLKLMLVLFLISSIFNYCLNYLMIKISRNVVKQMREDVFAKLMKLPVSYFDTHSTGDIISRISYDIDVINTSLSSDIIQIITSFITVTISFIMMISISQKLVLVFLITIPISIMLTKYMTAKTRPLFQKRSKSMGELNGFCEEILSGIKSITAYNKQEAVRSQFEKVNEECVLAYYKAEYYGSMVGPSVNFVNNLSLTLVSSFGAILYFYNLISLGNISSFVLYSRKFSGPINEMANIIAELQSALAACERVFMILDEKEEFKDKEDAKSLSQVNGDVRFEHVAFGYNNYKLIIKDLDLIVKSGQTIAIVGPTGAGKTTIINLLMRFYDTNLGNIYLDDQDIKKIKLKSLRSAYSLVLQDTWLFEGTVYENLSYGNNASLEKVKEVAKKAKIDSFIESLPLGYDTILTEDGLNISKGQKQLLTIARAMLNESKMLILDEATSNVDTQTEIQIQEAMLKLMEDKTCFIIAHRLSTIKNADLILVVKDGSIIERGNHQQLLAQKGYYYQLYNSQFE